MTATDRAALGAALCGAAGALLLVPTPVGIGSVIVAGVALAVLAVAGRRVTVAAVFPMLLVCVALVRAAEWVVLPSLAAAVLLGSFQLSDSVRRAVVLMPRALATLWRPLSTRWPVKGRYLRGAGLGIVLVIVFGTLFATADRAFAKIAADTLVYVDAEAIVLRMLAFVACAGLVGGLTRAERRDHEAGPRRRAIGPSEWGLALGLLTALFAAFCAVQIAVLFAGHAAVLEDAGLTYAEYAREGFFQLLAAAGLTLGVVAAAARWARRETPRDELFLRALLGALCILTLVILASALRRLGLYEEAFGFTRARLAAHAAMLWLASVFVLMLAHGLLRATRLWPVLVWTSGAAILIFASINPDALIARRNIDRFAATGDLDARYLSTLSADAVPALSALPPALRGCILGPIAARLGAPDPIVAFNTSRAHARSLLDHISISASDLICAPRRSEGASADQISEL